MAQFRPRPIDIDLQMPVLIQTEEQQEEDELIDEPAAPEEPTIAEPIPIPVYHDLQEPTEEEWKRPDYYLKYTEKTPAELDEIVEYEMDSEDEEFLASINSPQKQKSQPDKKSVLVTEDNFEKLVDILEKEAFSKIYKIPGRSFLDYIDLAEPPAKKHKRASINGGVNGSVNGHANGNANSNGTSNGNSNGAANGNANGNRKITDLFKDIEKKKEVEDIPCCICNDGDYDDNNLIVFCDGCNLPVHQTCYGIPKIPEDNWFCRRCITFGKGNQTTKCVLCGHAGGALKPTVVTGQWAHVLCALWIPEAAFLDATIMEPIDTSKISKARQGLECAICGTREGMCIQCKSRQCYTAFHPSCASKAGFIMEMTPNKSNTMIFKTYCDIHSQEIVAERARASSNDIGDIVRQICTDQVKAGLQVVLQLPSSAIDALCQYWVSKKRKHKGVSVNALLEGATPEVRGVNRPLIARLQMEEDAILQAHRRRRHMQVSVELSLMKQLRFQLDRVRILLDVTKKRELWKREYVKISMGILEALDKQIETRGYCDDIFAYTPTSSVSQQTKHHKTPVTPTRAATTPIIPTTPIVDKSQTLKGTQSTLDKFFAKPTTSAVKDESEEEEEEYMESSDDEVDEGDDNDEAYEYTSGPIAKSPSMVKRTFRHNSKDIS